MPELPDVEVFRRYMDKTSLNSKITSVEVLAADMLGKVSKKALEQRLTGSRFKSTSRRGKYMFAEIAAGGHLVLHFGMTGFLKFFSDDEEPPGHMRMRIDFTGGKHLGYDCRRKFGLIDMIDDPEEFYREKELGPDALDSRITFNDFQKLYGGRSSAVKAALMDQSLLAGIGNIYSDEILFQAEIHPATPFNKLDQQVLKGLYRRMQHVLEQAIKWRADAGNFSEKYLLVNRENGAECPRCGGEIVKEKIAGRSSYYCKKHQKQE